MLSIWLNFGTDGFQSTQSPCWEKNPSSPCPLHHHQPSTSPSGLAQLTFPFFPCPPSPKRYLYLQRQCLERDSSLPHTVVSFSHFCHLPSLPSTFSPTHWHFRPLLFHSRLPFCCLLPLPSPSSHLRPSGTHSLITRFLLAATVLVLTPISTAGLPLSIQYTTPSSSRRLDFSILLSGLFRLE